MQSVFVIITKLIASKHYFCKDFFCNNFGLDSTIELNQRIESETLATSVTVRVQILDLCQRPPGTQQQVSRSRNGPMKGLPRHESMCCPASKRWPLRTSCHTPRNNLKILAASQKNSAIADQSLHFQIAECEIASFTAEMAEEIFERS